MIAINMQYDTYHSQLEGLQQGKTFTPIVSSLYDNITPGSNGPFPLPQNGNYFSLMGGFSCHNPPGYEFTNNRGGGGGVSGGLGSQGGSNPETNFTPWSYPSEKPGQDLTFPINFNQQGCHTTTSAGLQSSCAVLQEREPGSQQGQMKPPTQGTFPESEKLQTSPQDCLLQSCKVNGKSLSTRVVIITIICVDCQQQHELWLYFLDVSHRIHCKNS